MLECTIIHILLITEHNGDILSENDLSEVDCGRMTNVWDLVSFRMVFWRELWEGMKCQSQGCKREEKHCS